MEKRHIELNEDVLNVTGDFKSAVLLSKFLEWDKEARKATGFDGWLHKTAEEISRETMMNMKVQTVRKYMLKLQKLGLIESRQSSTLLDRTYDYRVNHDFIDCVLGHVLGD